MADQQAGNSKPHRTRLRTWLPLVVTAISLYLLLPTLVAVLSSYRRLSHIHWVWAGVMLVAEFASYASIWELDRIALRTPSWLSVGAAQLSGNAVGRIVPGGGATATAFTVGMLKETGADVGEAAAGLSASTGLQLATTLALPLVALPAVLGGAPIDHSLEYAAYLGIIVLVVLLAVGGLAFAADWPLESVGRVVQFLLNRTVRRRRPVSGLPRELVDDRDSIRLTLGQRWPQALPAAAASTGFDYFALLCALHAVGADPRPALVLLAYTAAEVLALVPLTPGGLGFVEAGLVGMLTLAGVSAPDAVAATLLYRLVAYWLPLPAGGIAYLLFRRRIGMLRGSRIRSGESPIPGIAGSATFESVKCTPRR